MTRERFGQLLCGPLSHPLSVFTINRLTAALWFVVQETGESGARALENFCASRTAQDQLEDLERWPTITRS